MKKQPLVSIIMPVYNAENFLVEAIESILFQTYKNFEFIIVDDASTDNSSAIIKRYKKMYPSKIKIIRLKENRNNGGDRCANIGYQIAQGDYIARMDADDIAHPDRLTKQIKYMESHKEVILLGTQAYVIDKTGNITGEKLEPTKHEEILKSYFIYHPIIHPTAMIRKSMLPKRKALYQIKYNANNDLLTFFELLSYGKFANLSEKLLFYRIHGKNDSLTKPKERFLNTLKIRLYAWKNFNHKPSIKAILITMLQSLAVFFFPSSLVMTLYIFWKGINKSAISLK